MPIIEWDEDCNPTEESLENLRQQLLSPDLEKTIHIFYEALNNNFYPGLAGPEKKEVRGEIMNVLGFHTGGWSGNEEIIGILEESPLFYRLLERYDKGGHFYFKMGR